MTPQDHYKVIGIMHLIYGGFNALIMLIVGLFFIPAAALGASDPSAPAGLAALFGIMGVVIVVLGSILGLPSILAGYAMLKHKSWAKVMGIIAACIEAISFPFGTALCVYTFWFLFGQNEGYHRQGGQMGGPQAWNAAPPLRDANSTYDWEAQRNAQANRQRDYVPPPQPPDWRGQ
jgi:hypothetical protein